MIEQERNEPEVKVTWLSGGYECAEDYPGAERCFYVVVDGRKVYAATKETAVEAWRRRAHG